MVILLINSQNINGKIILVPRECNSTSLSERSVYGAIARQGCFLRACHAAAGERVVLFEKKVYNRDVVDAFGENVYRWGKSAGYCGGSVRS